jgi:hypothetical protein
MIYFLRNRSGYLYRHLHLSHSPFPIIRMVDAIIRIVVVIAGPAIGQVSNSILSLVLWDAIEQGKRDFRTDVLDDGTKEVKRTILQSPLPWSPYPSRVNPLPASRTGSQTTGRPRRGPQEQRTT